MPVRFGGQAQGDSMYDKLESIKERYHILSEQLSRMEVITSQDKFRELSQEHSSISEIVHLYDRLLFCQ